MNELKLFDVNQHSKLIGKIAGVDEAGRGPLAGPVVAAAVVFHKSTFIDGIDDSKKLTEIKRNKLVELIKMNALAFGIGIVDQYTIDEINILQASLRAMKIAVDNLNINPDLVLIDGNKSFLSDYKTKTIIKGDSKSFSIAAASILAKVERDHIMKKASLDYPQYAWERNKGYGTKFHIEAIKKHGTTDLHRKTFLRKILDNEVQGELI